MVVLLTKIKISILKDISEKEKEYTQKIVCIWKDIKDTLFPVYWSDFKRISEDPMIPIIL